MPSLRELRSALGAFAADKNDEELLQLASTAMGVSPGRIASEYGYKPTSSGIAGLRTGAAIDQYQAGLYGLGEAVTGADFFRRGRQANEFEANVALERARAQGAIGSFEEVQGLSDLPSYVGGLAIGSAPYAIEALGGGLAARGLMSGTRAALGAATAGGDAAAAAQATRALRVGQTAGGVAAAYPSAVGGILQAQREQSGETDLGSAAALGVPFAALNALGIEGALARQQMLRSGISALDNLQGVRGGLARAGASGVRTGLTESGTETLQEMTTQVGRMAVDPNEAFLSDAALGRYKESAIGGAFLGGTAGGLTGFGRSEQYRPPQREINLLTPEQPPAGIETPAPLGASLTGTDAAALMGNPLGGANLTKPTLISEETDLTKPLGESLTGTASSSLMGNPLAGANLLGTPAAPLTSTPRTELRDTYGVIATPSSLQFYDEIQKLAKDNNLELSDPVFQDVWNYASDPKPMTPKRLEKVQQLLDAAIINARKEAPSGTGISTVQQPAGGVGVGGAVVQGTVGAAGSNAPVTGTVAGSTATAGAPLQQAGLLPNAGGQPSTAVTDQPVDLTAAAPATKFRRAPKPMTVLEAANAAKAAQAQQTETQGSQAPAQPVVDERQVVLQQIFGERNGDIIFDVIGMGMSEPEAAAKYGLSRQAIQKIAGATGAETRAARVAKAKTELGLTDEQIQNAFTPPEQDVLGSAIEREIFGQAQPSSISETEAIEGGLENIVNTEGAGTSAVEGFTKLQKEIDATLEALQTETDEAKLEELNAKLAEQIVKVRAVEKRAQAEVRATAGKDTSTQVGEEDAVQVQSTAGVPVQPEAQTGQGVGGQVRSAEKPASQGQVQVLSDSEQAAQAWDKVASGYPTAPKFADLTKAQQQDFVDFGPDNWTEDDVNTELTKLAKSGLKFGKEAAAATQPYTAKQLISEIKAFIRTDVLNRKLTVVDSVEDLLNSPDKTTRAVGEAIKLQGAYGVAVDGRAFLVANRIKQGQGRAKFMHEVGGHLGLDNLLTKVQFDRLVDQIKKWSLQTEGSLETELALQAFERVQAAGTPKEDQRSELIAYFIESAMQMGIDPTGATDAKLSSPLREWFRTLWAAFKIAARKLGMKPETMTAQDVVNMAYGAARLEMNGVWHGTAATFRNFRNAYIGTGEGATAYGWGTYLAERVGIAKGYWKQDIQRKATEAGKPEGNLMRVDTAVAGDRVFDYDKPVIKQSNYVANELMSLLDPVADEVLDRTNKDIDELTGRDLIGTGENDLGLLSTLIMEDAITTLKPDAKFDEAVRRGKYHEAASHLLRTLGIDGIKFFDAQSRGTATQTISFDGKSYNRDQLRDMSRDAYKSNSTEEITKIIMLRHILRNGLDATKAEFEQKIANQIASATAVYQDTAQRYSVKESLEESRARAKELASQSYESQQLAWIKSNENKIAITESPRTQNLIVFDDKNVQRVGSEVAASPQRMQFGKNAPTAGVIQSNIAKLPKASQSPVRNIVRALGDLTGSGLDYVVFTSDLVKRGVAAGLTSAQTFADALSQRSARVSEFEREIEKIADGYADIEDQFKGAGRGSVNDFLFESTRTLKWGYDSGKLKADPEMAIAFNKLGPKAQQFVKNVFAHGDKILSQKKQSVLKAANSEYDAMIQASQNIVNTTTDAKEKQKAEGELAALKAEKVATLKRFQTLFAIREGKPYAPIKRDGSWVVIGKSAEYKAAETANDTAKKKKLESDPDHYHVSFVDTKWQARTLSDSLAEQGVFVNLDIAKRAEAFEEVFSGEALLPALTKIRSAVNKRQDSGSGRLLTVVNQLYLEALAEGSARKSEMRRRGVAGEVDMLQSFTRQGRADANFLASVEFEPLIQDALQSMRNEVRGGNRERKSEIFNELTKRYVDSLETKGNAFITGLTNTASKYFLASSPAYYMQNLTQPFMMSLPAMAGRHDYTKAGKALFDAYAELGPLFKNVKLFDQQFDFSKVPADVQAAIKELVNQGQIDIGLATEINEYKVDADNKLGKFAQRLNKSMRLAVQKAEAINRLSTAIAAYRLEFAKTKDAEKATQYAASILADTHGDYTAMNAPRIFNSQWGKIALQFRKFQLIQIAFYAKLLRDAFTNPAERAVAMRTLAFSLGHSAVFAGMMGLPGYAAVAAILGAFGDEDEPYDLTADMRQALGPEWADLIMRGAPTLVGVDLSGKIGSGNMLSIIPFSNADLSTTAGRAEAFGTLIGGASLGMASRVADGLGLILSGDYYKGIERTMPKGVSDALKAGRQAAEGMTRRNGDVVLPADEISAVSAVLTGLGVPSVKETVVYERQNRMRDVTQNFQERTTRIKNDYVKATRENDATAKQEAREAWTKLQRVRQENGLKVQPLSDLLKAPAEQRKREKMTVGGVQYTKGTRKLAEEIAGD